MEDFQQNQIQIHIIIYRGFQQNPKGYNPREGFPTKPNPNESSLNRGYPINLKHVQITHEWTSCHEWTTQLGGLHGHKDQHMNGSLSRKDYLHMLM